MGVKELFQAVCQAVYEFKKRTLPVVVGNAGGTPNDFIVRVEAQAGRKKGCC